MGINRMSLSNISKRFNTLCKYCRAYKNYTKKGINEKIYLIGFHIIIVERHA